MAPEQQPPGQVAGLQPVHAPPAQALVPQDWQARPPLPQAVLESPGRHTPFAQQPVGHETPLHTQAPSTHADPVGQAGPVPHVQAPAAEQPSAVKASHATQTAPPVPQVERARVRQTPPAQHPLGHEPGSQAPPSTRQLSEQPSPGVVLPSSHCSRPSRMARSPHTAGSPSASVAVTSLRATMVTCCCSLATTRSPLRPSTRTEIVCPALASASSTTAVSRPLDSLRGGLGNEPDAKAASPCAVTPDRTSSESWSAES